ncbi:glutathione S-transferase C-terminal domain-containing protein [Pigmentiphaga sp.]|uniref:glutathione S-transferase C-terminal domain-containing protein n=1 Tax=Pigmentiphaga sp. TaxID=1977564 RepID=UPI0039B9AC7C
MRRLDDETPALDDAPFAIGHITVGCALGYLDFRFASLDWRSQVPRLAGWYGAVASRPSFIRTEPLLEG